MCDLVSEMNKARLSRALLHTLLMDTKYLTDAIDAYQMPPTRQELAWPQSVETAGVLSQQFNISIYGSKSKLYSIRPGFAQERVARARARYLCVTIELPGTMTHGSRCGMLRHASSSVLARSPIARV